MKPFVLHDIIVLIYFVVYCNEKLFSEFCIADV
jgi:hypothetical protein